MAEIEVSEVPVDLAAALQNDAGVPAGVTFASYWRLQNRGPATVYRTEADMAPDPAAVRGFRHGSGSVTTVRLVSRVPTWVWCSSGTATLVLEVDPWPS